MKIRNYRLSTMAFKWKLVLIAAAALDLGGTAEKRKAQKILVLSHIGSLCAVQTL